MPLFRGVNTIDAERQQPPHAQQETIAHYKFTKTPHMHRAVAVSGNFKYYVVKNTRVRVLDAASPAKGLTNWPQEDVIDLEVAPASVANGLLGSATHDVLAMATAGRVVLWAVSPATGTAPDKVIVTPVFDLNAKGVLGVRWHPQHPVVFVLRATGVLAVHLSALRAASGTQQCLSADLDVSLETSARWCTCLPVPHGARLTALGVSACGDDAFLCLGTAQGGAYLARSQDDTDEVGSSFAVFAALQAPSVGAAVSVCGVVPFLASDSPPSAAAAPPSLLALVALQGGATWRAFEVPLRAPGKPLPLHQPCQVVALPGAVGSPPHGSNAVVLPWSGAAVTVHRDGTMHVMQAAANTPVLCRLYSAAVAPSSIASLAAGAARECARTPSAPPDTRENLFLVGDEDVTRVRVPLPPAPTVAVQAPRSASPPSSPQAGAPPTGPSAAGAAGSAGGGSASPSPGKNQPVRVAAPSALAHTDEGGAADTAALLRSMSRLQGQVDAMPAALNGAVMRAAQVAAAAATEGTADGFKEHASDMARDVQSLLAAALAPLLSQLHEAQEQRDALAKQVAQLQSNMLTPASVHEAIKQHAAPAIVAAVRSEVASAVPKAVASALAGHADAAKEAVRGATAQAFRNASTSLLNATQRTIAEQLQAQLPALVQAAVGEAMQHVSMPPAVAAAPEPLPNTGASEPTDEALRTKLLRLAAAAEYSPSIYETAFTVALESQAQGVLHWLCCQLLGEATSAPPSEVMQATSPIVAVCVMQQLTQGLEANVHLHTASRLQWLSAALERTADMQDAAANVLAVAKEVKQALHERVRALLPQLVAAEAAGQEGAAQVLAELKQLQSSMQASR